jgi:glycerate kinase
MRTGGGRVVVAPDEFKGSLTVHEAAGALAQGLRRAAPGTGIVELPIADGGEVMVADGVSCGPRSRARQRARTPSRSTDEYPTYRC